MNVEVEEWFLQVISNIDVEEWFLQVYIVFAKMKAR